jgi:hypothetical protein
MIKAGVRYTRMPDPAHVLSTRGGQGGRNEKQIITGRDALLKKSNPIILFSRADTVGPSVRKLIKGSFIHSFIHVVIRWIMIVGKKLPNINSIKVKCS